MQHNAQRAACNVPTRNFPPRPSRCNMPQAPAALADGTALQRLAGALRYSSDGLRMRCVVGCSRTTTLRSLGGAQAVICCNAVCSVATRDALLQRGAALAQVNEMRRKLQEQEVAFAAKVSTALPCLAVPLLSLGEYCTPMPTARSTCAICAQVHLQVRLPVLQMEAVEAARQAAVEAQSKARRCALRPAVIARFGGCALISGSVVAALTGRARTSSRRSCSSTRR